MKPAADIYAAAAALLHFLTGLLPTPLEPRRKSLSESTSLFHVAKPVRHDSAIDLSPLLAIADPPPGLYEVLERSLDRNPRRGFSTAAEMRNALLPFVAGPETS